MRQSKPLMLGHRPPPFTLRKHTVSHQPTSGLAGWRATPADYPLLSASAQKSKQTIKSEPTTPAVYLAHTHSRTRTDKRAGELHLLPSAQESVTPSFYPSLGQSGTTTSASAQETKQTNRGNSLNPADDPLPSASAHEALGASPLLPPFTRQETANN